MNKNYKARTKEEVLKALLDKMPDDYLKIPGTFTHDLNSSFAIETQGYEAQIEKLWDFFDIEKLHGEDLDERVRQLKGIIRKAATHATGKVTVEGNGIVKRGALFETLHAVQFEAVNTTTVKNRGDIEVKAVIPGEVGNVGANTILMMPVTLQGITAVNNKEQTFDGFDAETDESLRERYLIAVRTPATSGNVYHYKQWAREVEGVGKSRVFPLWKGNNTVKVVITDANQQPPSRQLVDKVQTYIDPMEEGKWGAGYGQAPVGAYCTVAPAKAKKITVNAKIVKESTYSLQEVKEGIEANVAEFLRGIAFEKDYCPFSLVANAVLTTPGVVEWTEMTVNGGIGSVEIEKDEVAILGGVTIHEQTK